MKNKQKSLFLKIVIPLIMILFKGAITYSHGEEKLGPNGGFILMPGAFHTELVPLENDKFKVYLLDMNWENPSVKDSSIEVKLILSKKTIQIKCTTDSNYYSCMLEKGANLKKGKLEILAQREGMKGNLAVYQLPLKLGGSHDSGH